MSFLLPLLKYWPYILGTIATLILFFIINSWRIDAAKVPSLEERVSELEVKLKTLKESHEKSLKATEEGNKYYQSILVKRDADIAQLSKRPARCLYVSKPAINSNSGQLQPGKGNGLPDSILYRFSSFCETDRGGLETLQAHLGKVRCEIK